VQWIFFFYFHRDFIYKIVNFNDFKNNLANFHTNKDKKMAANERISVIGGGGVFSFKSINHWQLRLWMPTLPKCSSFKRFRFNMQS